MAPAFFASSREPLALDHRRLASKIKESRKRKLFPSEEATPPRTLAMTPPSRSPLPSPQTSRRPQSQPPTRLNRAEGKPNLPPPDATSKTSLKCQFYGTDPIAPPPV